MLAGQLRIGFVSDEKELAARLPQCDVVLVCVPLEKTRPAFLELFSLARGAPGPITWVETGSVKLGVDVIAAKLPAGHSFLSIHPLTANVSPEQLSEQRLIICKEVGDTGLVTRWLSSPFLSGGTAHCTLDEHDRAMAVVQVASHFLSLSGLVALADFCSWSGLRLDGAKHPLLLRLVASWARVARNSSVFLIQERNPYASQVRHVIAAPLPKLADARRARAASGRRQALPQPSFSDYDLDSFSEGFSLAYLDGLRHVSKKVGKRDVESLAPFETRSYAELRQTAGEIIEAFISTRRGSEFSPFIEDISAAEKELAVVPDMRPIAMRALAILEECGAKGL
jgi:prephenate dehydrogenase